MCDFFPTWLAPHAAFFLYLSLSAYCNIHSFVSSVSISYLLVFDVLLDILCVVVIIVSVTFFPCPRFLSCFLSLGEFRWNRCTMFCSRIPYFFFSPSHSFNCWCCWLLHFVICVCLYDGLPLPWTYVSSPNMCMRGRTSRCVSVYL